METVPKSRTILRACEVAFFSLFLAALNCLFPGDPGFLKSAFNPYLILAIILSPYYGKYYGFLSLFLSAFLWIFPLPVALSWLQPATAPASRMALAAASAIPMAVTLGEVYVLGLIRDSLMQRAGDARSRLQKMAREKGLLNRQVRSLRTVNLEFEERLSRQEESITSLYGQVQALYSVNLEKALQSILEMARRFVGATRCSIWEYRGESKSLVLVSTLGWENEDEGPSEIPAEESIEGWVLRNNMMFSVKMLLEYENLKKLDKGRNIMTLPIVAGRSIWGVLNIEDMPFAKYNLFAEKLLLMVMALAAPALERAIDFQAVVRQEDVNPVTGLPSFLQFFSMLANEVKRTAAGQENVTILVLDLTNFTDLVGRFGKDAVLLLMVDLTKGIRELAQGHVRFFHYKADSQLALLCPGLGSDGASLFSLNLLEMINGGRWMIREERVFLEVILGFSVAAGATQSVEDLLGVAENLLLMQKV